MSESKQELRKTSRLRRLVQRRQIVSICLTTERLQEAEEVLLELDKRMPDNFLTQFTLAQLYFQQHRPQAGLPYAQKSVAMKRDEAETYRKQVQKLSE